MHRSAQRFPEAFLESALIERLSSLFAEPDTGRLFERIFVWYLAPSISEHERVKEETARAYNAYKCSGILPDFFARIPEAFLRERAIIDSPTRGRKLLERDSSEIKVALGRALLQCERISCEPYDKRNCPHFWELVFKQYFERVPTGASDAEWDTLFDSGMPALRKILGDKRV